MKAIVVDDEIYMLETLQEAVNASSDIEMVEAFTSCSAALTYATENPIDVAFLDINMRGIGGLGLAEKLLELQPFCKIVFCTGYEEYAVSAFQLHVSGYLMKPITSEDVQKEIDHIKGVKATEKLLTIKCFGNFEVYCRREPLSFRRFKTKEVFAYLVDRKGAGVTTKEICAKLWEDHTDDKKNLNYLYQLMNDLTNALKEVGAEGVIVKTNSTYAVDVDRLDCDYYTYLEIGKPMFMGEYMMQYGWAEATCALLLGKQV